MAKAAHAQKLGSSGTFLATIYFYDPALSPATTVWDLGGIEIEVDSHLEQEETLLPEIYPIFRKPEADLTSNFPFWFLAVSLSPWALLIGIWSILGANIQLMTVDSFFFMATLVSWVALLVLYWHHLNIFEFMGYSSILGPISIVFGISALRSRNQMGKLNC